MKLLILSLCVAYAIADVSHILKSPGSEKTATILKQELDVGPDGNYQWAYETDNGIVASETGSLQKAGPEDASIIVQGQASWVAPNGEPISFSYTADENGYQAQGAYIPTPPPIPEAIIRALEYIRAHPPPPEKP